LDVEKIYFSVYIDEIVKQLTSDHMTLKLLKQVQYITASQLRVNTDNPRQINKDKYEKLKQSIIDFPEMLEARPIVVNTNGLVLGGNMRYRACLELKIEKIPAMVVNLPIEKEKEFIIKDNASFGDWDWDILANEWDIDQLINWGINYVWPDVEEAEKDNVTQEEIAEMNLRFMEHHDYIVLLFDNQNDYVTALTMFQIGKARVSLSPKKKILGLGRVVAGKKILEMISHENSDTK
jgi:arsenate reductase-like glutaredoxin family protein